MLDSEYEMVSILIGRNGFGNPFITSGNRKSFTEIPQDFINRFLGLDHLGDFKQTPIVMLEELLRIFNIVDTNTNYCNNCGIELQTDDQLCWACEHGI